MEGGRGRIIKSYGRVTPPTMLASWLTRREGVHRVVDSCGAGRKNHKKVEFRLHRSLPNPGWEKKKQDIMEKHKEYILRELENKRQSLASENKKLELEHIKQTVKLENKEYTLASKNKKLELEHNVENKEYILASKTKKLELEYNVKQ